MLIGTFGGGCPETSEFDPPEHPASARRNKNGGTGRRIVQGTSQGTVGQMDQRWRECGLTKGFEATPRLHGDRGIARQKQPLSAAVGPRTPRNGQPETSLPPGHRAVEVACPPWW